MERKNAYANLAKWFEYLNDDCDYENWSQYLVAGLKAYPLTAGIDIGCGGGWFTRAFERAGYRMSGLDISPEMLGFAEEQARKEGVRSAYLLGDIVKTKLPKRFDFASAVNDCVNYIPKEKLLSAFKNVHSALNKNGIFVFDISSERKFREKIADTVSVDDRDEVTYLCFNHVENDRATLDVTLFIKNADGSYDRRDERHLQYIYKEEEIAVALEHSGFRLLKAEGHLGEEKQTSDRICFWAQKI
ncbi:MAG: class I SAM-dependent methyltransferase [Clostridia bacterium]|nr:class I SAM-dependent methyltransferase [Clostridia bacterium]